MSRGSSVGHVGGLYFSVARIMISLLLMICCLSLSTSLALKRSVSYQSTSCTRISSYNYYQSYSISNHRGLYMSLMTDTPYRVWTLVAGSAAVGLTLEKKTSFGKALSGPVVSMLFTAFLTNVGVLPPPGSSTHIACMQKVCVALATPLLLLGADLSRIKNESKGLLKCFLLGSFGTILGSSLGFLFAAPHLASFGTLGDSWKLASALTAKNIGGGLNFVAVADALQVSASAGT